MILQYFEIRKMCKVPSTIEIYSNMQNNCKSSIVVNAWQIHSVNICKNKNKSALKESYKYVYSCKMKRTF